MYRLVITITIIIGVIFVSPPDGAYLTADVNEGSRSTVTTAAPLTTSIMAMGLITTWIITAPIPTWLITARLIAVPVVTAWFMSTSVITARLIVVHVITA
jgi:hypothetical protein